MWTTAQKEDKFMDRIKTFYDALIFFSIWTTVHTVPEWLIVFPAKHLENNFIIPPYVTSMRFEILWANSRLLICHRYAVYIKIKV